MASFAAASSLFVQNEDLRAILAESIFCQVHRTETYLSFFNRQAGMRSFPQRLLKKYYIGLVYANFPN